MSSLSGLVSRGRVSPRSRPLSVLPQLLYILVIALVPAAVPPAAAQAAVSKALVDRSLCASRAVAAPVLDGSLDDPCWAQCAIGRDFFDMGRAGPVTQATLVRVCFDEQNLYVAFECLEDRMDETSAAISQRDDGNLFDVDDSVAVLLDTYHDRRSCYAFAVNMAATRLDLRVAESGRSQDLGWDAVWDAAAARSEDGWTVEMAIPFSAMRFVPGESVTWGVEFLRHSTPSREESRWVHYEGDVLDPQQFADLTGLSCSDASRDLEVTVAAVGRYDVEDYRDYQDLDWTVERVRIDWLLSRDSFVRLITQGAQIRIGLDDGDLRTEQYDLSLLYGWEFRPGSMFYLAYNQILDGGDGDGQFRDPVVVAKVSYLFTM